MAEVNSSKGSASRDKCWALFSGEVANEERYDVKDHDSATRNLGYLVMIGHRG